MVFVLIGWVTLSLLFCIAFCCAAARRQPRLADESLNGSSLARPCLKKQPCVPETVLLAKPLAERAVPASV